MDSCSKVIEIIKSKGKIMSQKSPNPENWQKGDVIVSSKSGKRIPITNARFGVNEWICEIDNKNWYTQSLLKSAGWTLVQK
jgi:hypothetical protein